MAYVGRKPEIGNYRKADSITTSATATYNLLVGGVAVNPNQNQVICSLNGVVQSSGDSYTIANSQITFASALTSSDVIDFILILGDVLDSGTPSDDTVSTAKIQTNAVTNAKMADDAIGVAELSATGTASSSTFLRGDNAWATAGGDLSFGGDTFGADKTVGANDAYAFSLETSGNVAIKMDASGHVTKPLQPAFLCRGLTGNLTTATSWTAITTWNTETFDTNSDFNTTNGTFTAPVTGKYFFQIQIQASGHNEDADLGYDMVTSNGQFTIYADKAVRNSDGTGTQYSQTNRSIFCDMDASDTIFINQICNPASSTISSAGTHTFFAGYLVC